MGDFNTFVSESNVHVEHIMGKDSIGRRSDNGERFVDFCNANNMAIGGTCYFIDKLRNANIHGSFCSKIEQRAQYVCVMPNTIIENKLVDVRSVYIP